MPCAKNNLSTLKSSLSTWHSNDISQCKRSFTLKSRFSALQRARFTPHSECFVRRTDFYTLNNSLTLQRRISPAWKNESYTLKRASSSLSNAGSTLRSPGILRRRVNVEAPIPASWGQLPPALRRTTRSGALVPLVRVSRFRAPGLRPFVPVPRPSVPDIGTQGRDARTSGREAGTHGRVSGTAWGETRTHGRVTGTAVRVAGTCG
jgi:hypothetical protein